MPIFSFHHGLGDCSNAAHLFALYKARGHFLSVECGADKAPLFQAAGCQIVDRAPTIHPWEHAPPAGPMSHHDHWSGNKTAWNISRPPLPDIGPCWEGWADLCSVKLNLDAFVTRETEREVEEYVRALPRPLILIAPQGNTGIESKNLNHEIQMELLRCLLDDTSGSIIQLDWDQRVFKLPNWRIRHLGDDWRRLGIPELYFLIKISDLVIGCDSGVLHFTRFTDTPAIGAWTLHHPSQFALPRGNSMHIVSRFRNELNRCRRIPYNIVECPGERLSGQFIANQAATLLSGPKYLRDRVPDAVLQHLIENCRQFDSPMTSYVDRHRTFAAFLSIAKRKAHPLIVETGTLRAVEDWSAGYSTYLLGYFLSHHGGQLHSIDLDARNVAFARRWTGGFASAVQVHQAHSHVWLAAYSGPPIDLLYLDSADVGTTGYQQCALREVELALPRLAPDAVILFDDTCWKAGNFQGKGGTAVPWLLQRGWKVVAGGYQVMLGKENSTACAL